MGEKGLVKRVMSKQEEHFLQACSGMCMVYDHKEVHTSLSRVEGSYIWEQRKIKVHQRKAFTTKQMYLFLMQTTLEYHCWF